MPPDPAIRSGMESRTTSSEPAPGQKENRGRAVLLVFLLPALGLLWGGCKVARETAALPTQMVTAVVPGKKSSQPDPAQLQGDLLRFADDFFARTSAGLDEYARRMNTPGAHSEAKTWKLGLNSSALGIATGMNPTANLVDFLALTSLSRALLERRATNVLVPGAFDLWLENTRILETNAWRLAERSFSPDQQTEFRAAINQWLEQDTGTAEAFFRRPQQFAAGLRETGERDERPSSIFSLASLDPTAGLDPAVREITRSRLFAERAMFSVQHMPYLLRWQIELLEDQMLRQEQITNTITSVDRLSRAAESASQTAAALPDRLTAERKAMVEALDSQEGKLRDLSAEVSRTLAAGEKMSSSLNITLTNFDGLMKRFGVGEPRTTPPNTNAAPFNILDYARTAEQIAAMAKEVDALVKDASGTVNSPALDKRIADLSAVSARARGDAKSVLNHAFLLAAGLVVLVFACAAVYRRAGRSSS
jgi:hypothetical protein